MSEREHSVEGGVIRRLSVSQVTSFDPRQYGGCPRRWFFARVMHLPEGKYEAQEDGVEGHGYCEGYLLTGAVPDATKSHIARVFREGRWMLPTPGPGLHVEDRLGGGRRGDPFNAEGTPLKVEGIPFDGYMDLVHDRVLWHPERPENPPNTVNIEDHKFVNPNYAKTGSDLLKTVQMTGYGVAELAERHRNAEWVRLTHNNFSKNLKVKSFKSSILVSVDSLLAAWKPVPETVKAMKQVAREVDPVLVPKGPKEACNAWRKPCPFQKICGLCEGRKPVSDLLSAEDLALMGDMDTGLLKPAEEVATEAMAAAVQKAATTAPAAVAATAEQKAAFQEKMAKAAAATKKPSLVMPDCTGCGVSLNPDNASQLRDGSWKHIGCGGPVAVLPPDAPKSDSQLASACEKCPPDAKDFQHKPEDCPTAAAEKTASEKAAAKEAKKAEKEAAKAKPKKEPAPAVQEASSPTTTVVQNISVAPGVTPEDVATAAKDAWDSTIGDPQHRVRTTLAVELILSALKGQPNLLGAPAELTVKNAFALADAIIAEGQS